MMAAKHLQFGRVLLLPRSGSKNNLRGVQRPVSWSQMGLKTSTVVTSLVVPSPINKVDVPDMNLSEFIWRKSDRWKHWPAITDGVTGTSYTFGEARAVTERLSASMPASLGLKPGDTLGIVMPNAPEFTFSYLAAAEAGIVVSPANPLYTPEELAHQLSNAGARHVVTSPILLPKVRAAVELIPGGAQILVATDGSGPQEAAVAQEGLPSLHELMKRELSRRTPRPSPPDPDSLAALPYSSGTTGLPKGVRLTHRNLVANLCQMEHPDIMPPAPEGVQDVAVNILPYFHIYGMNGVMNLSVSLGRHSITLPRFEPGLFASVITKYKPSVLSLVPPLLLFLIASPNVAPEDLARIRFVSSGAAAASKPIIEKFIQRANSGALDFREGFGMTETSCLATFTPSWAGLTKVGSCGVPVPLTEIKIVDESGEAVARNQHGELLVRGPQVMQGYHNNEEATRETFTEDGWLKTGDVAYIDEDSYVYLVDRIKELIKVKGLQVSPTELEAVLRKMEGIADVAVVGVPDERAGEVPRAFVVRSPGSTITENKVTAFLEGRVAPFKRLIGGVRFVEAIPKNAGGKTLRKELKKVV